MPRPAATSTSCCARRSASPAAPAPRGVRVEVTADGYSQTHYTHFKTPDATSATHDGAAYPSTTGATDLDSLYHFELRAIPLTRTLESVLGTTVSHHKVVVTNGEFVLLGAAAAAESPGLVAGPPHPRQGQPRARSTRPASPPTAAPAHTISIEGFTDLSDTGSGWLDVNVDGSRRRSRRSPATCASASSARAPTTSR